MSKTRIYRSGSSSNYSVINNEILKRNDISWKAKGILIYILSLPDDWVLYLEELQNHATDKKASFRTGWKELTEKGYVKRYPIRDKGKIIEWRTEIRETVGISTISPQTDFQEVENLEVENLEVENQKLLSTNNTNYLNTQNTNNKKPSQSEKLDFENLFKEIWDIYPNKKGMQSAKRKFIKVVKSLKDAEIIKEGVTKYAYYCKTKQVQPQFIRHGSTFFNNESWLDDWTSDLPENVSKWSEPDYSIPKEFDNPQMSDLNEKDFPF